MAYQRLQVSEGLAVIPSNTVPIPDPASEALSGTADFSVASTLTDVGTTFLSDGIQMNAIVYNTTAQIAYFVTAVTDDLNLALSPATTGGAADNYIIFNAPTNAATLYVGTTGDLVVEMASQRDSGATPTLTFKAAPAGFMPTLVTKVGASTAATDIIALW
jgi:hypothetical protein